MYTNKTEIESWLNKMDIDKYTINEDLTVDVKGSVYLDFKKISTIPFQFGIIEGNFTIYNNKLTSLRGSPKEIKGFFNCGKNNLKNFKYCPDIIEGDFRAGENKVTNFKYMPKRVKGEIEVLDNPITDMRNSMEYVGNRILAEVVEGFEQFIHEKDDLIELSLSDINNHYNNIDLSKKLNKELPNKTISKKAKI